MAIKVQNATSQMIPLVIPSPQGGEQVNVAPRKTVILAIDKPTDQINQLAKARKLKIKK